jgi:AAA domain
VESYSLRVESGLGIDLNRSMFERLVLAGYPHAALQLQHRMPPAVSALVRGMTYPALRDSPSTAAAPPVRGLRNRVCFVSHTHAEAAAGSIIAQRQEGGTASKVNEYEADMIVATALYLLQQGYAKEQIVILTPYLAQLQMIKGKLSASGAAAHISTADSKDLESAGLSTADTDSTTAVADDNAEIDSTSGSCAVAAQGNSKQSDKQSVKHKRGNNSGNASSSGAKGSAPVSKATANSLDKRVSGGGIRVATVDNYQRGTLNESHCMSCTVLHLT